MIHLILFVLSLCGYTQGECDICGWPYSTGVNSDGKCYLSYEGMQGNLSGGCYVYCDAWARSGGISQSATPMLSFADAGGGVTCQCQRLNSYGEIEYRVRPTATCDFGYSDKVQGFYDQIAVNLRESKTTDVINSMNNFSSSSVESFFTNLKALEDQYHGTAGQYACGDYEYPAQNLSGHGIIYQVATEDYETYPAGYYMASVGLPPGASCADYYAGNLSTTSIAAKRMLENQLAQDTALNSIKNGIDNIQKTLSGQNKSVLDALAQLQAKPTGGGGGGTPTDLSGVLAAIEASKNENLNATRALGDSIGSLKSVFAGRMASLTSSVDSVSAKITGLSADITSLGEGIGELNGTMKDVKGEVTKVADSVSSLKPHLKGIADSLGGLKAYYVRISDSMGVSNRLTRSSLDSLGSLNRSVKGSADSIGRFRRQSYVADSLVDYRYRKGHTDDSSAYETILDSLKRDVPGKADAQGKLNGLGDASSDGEAKSGSFLGKLAGFQSLPGTCSEVPVMSVDLSSVDLGSMSIDMGHYGWAVGIMRGMFRFLGAAGGLMMVLGAMKLLGGSSKKE